MKTTLYNIDIDLPPKRVKLLGGGWENKRLQSMLLNISPGDVVFDIGAEQGDITALLGRAAGNRVVAIEPSPIMWPHIRSNLQRNKVKLLTYYCGFAANEIKEHPSHLNYDDKNVKGYPACAYEKKKYVPCFRHLHEEQDATRQITLDHFCKNTGWYPSVVTMDVEGSEWNVLDGMTEVIEKSQPIIYVSIHFDFLLNNYDKQFDDIYFKMLNLGYKCRFLDYDHEGHFVFYKKSIKMVNEVI